jgi:hypothetical protein
MFYQENLTFMLFIRINSFQIYFFEKFRIKNRHRRTPYRGGVVLARSSSGRLLGARIYRTSIAYLRRLSYRSFLRCFAFIIIISVVFYLACTQ